VNKIRSNLDKNEDQAILNWISPGDDYGTQQSHHLRRREPETGQWLLDMEAFRTWLAGRRGSLFCRGMPGAGKTILNAVVVDHLIRKCADKDKSAIGVAFLYCSISQKERQKTEDLLLSILKHFSQGLPSLPESVRALHQTHQGARTRPLLAEIVNCLEAVVQTYRQTFVIVDALDECALDCRSPLLKTLFRLRDAHGVNLFATSNHSIEIPFPKSSVVEIKANPNDVQRYLDAHMSELPGFVTGRPGLRDRIKQAIARAACGMFLMVYLYLRYVRPSFTSGT
jgi:Cdc6-like AAA superfamily ATPase